MVFFYFNSQPRTKQKYVSYENEGLSGMLKLCTAVMRHDPSFKMSPAGLVGDMQNSRTKKETQRPKLMYM